MMERIGLLLGRIKTLQNKLIKLSIKDAYQEYRVVQNINGVRESTLDRVDHSMKNLYKVFGEKLSHRVFEILIIEQYKEYWDTEHINPLQ